ncbi:somatostatin receptor type 5-like [Saccoglossus kowalevskii]|uniref:Somatostatin receptor type 5-like n=1 Tax=Saccoglossus kowalevskii TaxID=10224 RepID=A0ABM0M135_SACKO|nr:PREDICTED: somatostatin receptor type 5-like [Saccoglossus kowalevskii]
MVTGGNSTFNESTGSYYIPGIAGQVSPLLFNTILPVIFGIICFSGLIGNALVIYVLLRRSKIKTVANVYILNLASADFLFVVMLPFLAYTNSGSNWIMGEAVCKLVHGVDGLNMFAGIFTLVALSFDRYLAVVHGLRSRKYRTIKAARMTCVLIWVLAFLVTVPLWVSAVTIEFYGITLCEVAAPEWMPQSVFIQYGFVTGFCVPLAIISVCYASIVIHLTQLNCRDNILNKRPHRSHRVTIMVLLVVLLFIVCWLPFWVVHILRLFERFNNYNITMPFLIAFYFSLCLSYANSCLNPIIYTYAGENFRRNLALLCRSREKKHFHVSSPNKRIVMTTTSSKRSRCYSSTTEDTLLSSFKRCSYRVPSRTYKKGNVTIDRTRSYCTNTV